MTNNNPQDKAEFKARLAKARQKHDESSWDGQELKVEQAGAAGRAWRLSVEMVAAFLVCGGFGWWLDSFFDTKPVFLLVFAILGMFVGVYNVYKVARAMNPEDFED